MWVPLPFFPGFQKEHVIVVCNLACLVCGCGYSMQKFHLTSSHIVWCPAYINYLLQQGSVFNRPCIVETSDYVSYDWAVLHKRDMVGILLIEGIAKQEIICKSKLKVKLEVACRMRNQL